MYNTQLNSANAQYIGEKLNAILAIMGMQPMPLTAFVTPTDNERVRWLSVKESIKPHLLGQMPTRITAAFPNEDERQKRYRASVYCSASQPLLGQAIDNVYKVVQSDDFVVSYNENTANELSRVFVAGERLAGANLQKQVLNVLYKARVLDPNGYWGLVYRGDMETQRLGGFAFDIEIYPSENIVAKSDTVMIFALPDKYGVSAVAYRAYLPTLIIDFTVNGEVLGNMFAHNGASLCCYCLGGKAAIDEEINGLISGTAENNAARLLVAGSTRVIEFYESDFSFAVSQLDALEIANSKNDIVRNLHAHPNKIMIEIPCGTCDGLGYLDAMDKDGNPIFDLVMRNGVEINEPRRHTCHTCNGKGVVSTGAQDVITIPNTTPINIGEQPRTLASLKDSVVAYVTPDIASANYLKEVVMAMKNECKEMLNLHRLEDFSQSGVSKSIDTEAGYTRLRGIAEGIGGMISELLKSVVVVSNGGVVQTEFNQRAIADGIAAVNVSIPSYFDMRSSTEAQAAYFENLEAKNLDQRYSEQLNILKKRNASAEELAAFDIAYDYTDGLNLKSQTELLELLGAGLIDEVQMYKAMNVGAMLKRIKRAAMQQTRRPLLFAQLADYRALYAQLDAELTTYRESVEARRAAPMTIASASTSRNVSNDSEDDDEDDTISE